MNISLVTDSDAGDGASEDASSDEVSAQLVFERMAAAQPRLLSMLGAIVEGIPDGYTPRQLIPAEAVGAVLAAKTVR